MATIENGYVDLEVRASSNWLELYGKMTPLDLAQTQRSKVKLKAFLFIPNSLFLPKMIENRGQIET